MEALRKKNQEKRETENLLNESEDKLEKSPSSLLQ